MSYAKNSYFKTAFDFDVRQIMITLEKIAEQNKILAIVKTALPADIAPHLQHCLYSENCLLIYTNSASWASQIRFFQKDILCKILESGQYNISRLQVKILPPFNEQSSKRIALTPSAQNLEFIRNQRNCNQTDDVLSQAFARLVKTLDKRLKANN